MARAPSEVDAGAGVWVRPRPRRRRCKRDVAEENIPRVCAMGCPTEWLGRVYPRVPLSLSLSLLFSYFTLILSYLILSYLILVLSFAHSFVCSFICSFSNLTRRWCVRQVLQLRSLRIRWRRLRGGEGLGLPVAPRLCTPRFRPQTIRGRVRA